ncbi:hypothetical protein PG989_006854 [Apiospora arundinis]
MVTEKLKRYMSLRHSTSASQLDAQKPADKIRAAHLEEGRGGRRPASWRESEITRTKDEARSIIRGHEARIKRGEISLGELAMSQSESDCSSACKRGDLGYFGEISDLRIEPIDPRAPNNHPNLSCRSGIATISALIDSAPGSHATGFGGGGDGNDPPRGPPKISRDHEESESDETLEQAAELARKQLSRAKQAKADARAARKEREKFMTKAERRAAKRHRKFIRDV